MTSLLEQRRDLIARATAIVDAAKSQNRADLTVAETKSINDHLAAVDALDLKIKAADDSADVFRRLSGKSPGLVLSDDAPGMAQFKSLFAAARAGQSLSVEIPRKAFVAVTLPTIVTGQFVPGDYPGLTPRILDLFAQQPATGPVQRIYRVSTPGTAEVVAEGAPKPDAGIEVEPVDVPLTKIAALCKLSDELSEDQPTFVSALQQELGMAVLSEENVYASGVILATSGVLTQGGDNVVDGVADSIAKLATTNGSIADGVVLHPNDLAAVRKSKADTSGTYVVDPQTSAPGSLHGLTLVVSTAVTAGTLLVGSFASAGTAYARSGLRIDLGLDADDFSHNLRTARAEERVALGLTRPGHLVKLTITP